MTALKTVSSFLLTPSTAGGWDLGGVTIMVTRRPNWFQRLMYRIAFGWIWVPAKVSR